MKTVSCFMLIILCVSRISTRTIHNQNERSARIVDGTIATTGEFPFAAAIYYTNIDGGTYFCGGALISNQFVLTAAHCGYQAISFIIRLGIVELDDNNAQTVSTSQFIAHSSFDAQSLENDIGLIKFRMPIVLSDYVQPIILTSTEIDVGLVLKALGWGSTSDDMSGLSNDLNYIDVAALSNAECNSIYPGQISENMVCVAGNTNGGVCRGDLGGPLVLTLGRFAWHLGVASFLSNVGGCESPYPAGFTRTYPYVSWINEVMNS